MELYVNVLLSPAHSGPSSNQNTINMKTIITSRPPALAAAMCAICIAGSSAHAAISYTTYIAEGNYGNVFFDPGLTGTASSSSWLNVRMNGSVSIADGGTGVVHAVGSFPGSGPFVPIAAQVGDSTAQLIKTANGTGGGPYVAGDSIYYGGFSGAFNNPGGTMAVTVPNPIADLSTLVFQVQIGEAWTYDFLDHALPVLSYTTSAGTVNDVAADFSSIISKIANGTVSMPSGPEPIFFNTHALQWDLSAVVDPITSFNVSFQGVQHAQLKGLRLDQGSDSFTGVNLVPEPTSAALGLMGAVALLIRRRRH